MFSASLTADCDRQPNSTFALLEKPRPRKFHRFSAFRKHLSEPHILHGIISSFHSLRHDLAGRGSALIRRTMFPNSRLVRWLTARISQ